MGTTAGRPRQPGTGLPRRSHRHRGESGRRPVFHGQLIEQVARQIMQVDNPNFDPATHYGGPTLNEDCTVTRNGRVLDAARRGLPTDAPGPPQ